MPARALLCLASAAAFGAMGIFGKLAYDEGATVGTLLATRFVLAAALLWLLVGDARRCGRVSRRDVGIALALGAVGYGAQAGGYFAALERLDASLLSLLVYIFPVIVTRDRRRTRARARRAAAPPSPSRSRRPASCSCSRAPRGALDPLGTLLGLGTAVDLQRLRPQLGRHRRAGGAARADDAGVHAARRRRLTLAGLARRRPAIPRA